MDQRQIRVRVYGPGHNTKAMRMSVGGRNVIIRPPGAIVYPPPPRPQTKVVKLLQPPSPQPPKSPPKRPLPSILRRKLAAATPPASPPKRTKIEDENDSGHGRALNAPFDVKLEMKADESVRLQKLPMPVLKSPIKDPLSAGSAKRKTPHNLIQPEVLRIIKVQPPAHCLRDIPSPKPSSSQTQFHKLSKRQPSEPPQQSNKSRLVVNFLAKSTKRKAALAAEGGAEDVERDSLRRRWASRNGRRDIRNTGGSGPRRLLSGIHSYNAKRQKLLLKGGAQTPHQLIRLTDQWEKKKKALSLIHWAEIGTLARDIREKDPQIAERLEEFYKMLDVQSIIIRGHSIEPSDPPPKISPWRLKIFDMQVRTFRQRMAKLFDFSHGNGRLPRHMAGLEFLTFCREKERMKEEAQANGKTNCEHEIKILADRWERRKKSVAFNSVNLLMDCLYLNLKNDLSLLQNKSVIHMIKVMNEKRHFIHGEQFWQLVKEEEV